MPNTQFHQFELIESLLDQLARFIAKSIQEKNPSTKNKFRIALSGGSTPRQLYTRLSQDDISDRIDWSNVEIFWGDERHVPLDDPQSNYLMSQTTLLRQIPIPKENVYPVPVHLTASKAAKEYANTLEKKAPLDLILLGLGTDGHTASLFPDTKDLFTKDLVIATESPLAPKQRISFSLHTINSAQKIVFLVTGKKKSQPLATILNKDKASKDLPAAMVQPTNGQLHWFLDKDAASLIPKELTR